MINYHLKDYCDNHDFSSSFVSGEQYLFAIYTQHIKRFIVKLKPSNSEQNRGVINAFDLISKKHYN